MIERSKTVRPLELRHHYNLCLLHVSLQSSFRRNELKINLRISFTEFIIFTIVYYVIHSVHIIIIYLNPLPIH